MRRLVALVVTLLLGPLTAGVAYADSDGYFCIGPDYLAYQFGMAGPSPGEHHVYVVPLTRDRVFAEAMAIELPQFQVHGMRCHEDRIRVASFEAEYGIQLAEGRQPVSVTSQAFERSGAIPADFLWPNRPGNLGFWARLDETLAMRVVLFSDGDHEFAIEVEPERATVRRCRMELISRIVERDGTGREVGAREILRGQGHRECGELAHLYLDRLVPPADLAHERVGDADAWPNPYLLVRDREVDLRVRGPEPDRRTVRLQDLRTALTGLPLGAWPLGRVVAVEERPTIGARPSGLRETVADVLETVEALGLTVSHWPKAGPQERSNRPVFDCYYANFAMVPMVNGRFVDDTGAVVAYDRRSRERWRLDQIIEEGRTVVRVDDLMAKFANPEAVSSVGQIVLDDRVALITAAARGPIRREDGGVRDAGSRQCEAYIYHADRSIYEVVPLGTYGDLNDMIVINESDAARELMSWLRSVGVAR